MLLEQRVQDRINDAIDQAYLSFLITLIGYDVLSADDKRKATLLGLVQINRPLIDSLYSVAKQRSTERDRKPVKLRDLIAYANLQGVLPLTDAQAYSLEHAKREMYDALQNSREEYQKKIRQAILRANDDARHTELAQNVTSQERQSRRAMQVGVLLVGLSNVLQKLEDSFTKGATVALTNLINNAAVDEISINSLVNQVKAGEALVYKKVVNDGSLCAWCSKFYTNKDGSPKVYKLSELLANGSNDGLPKSSWRAVVGSTHPRCRCQLHYLAASQKPQK